MSINVTDCPYNAVGNGVDDATAAIQSAIDTAQACGAEVFIPKGVYLITAPLEIPIQSPPAGVTGQLRIRGEFASLVGANTVSGGTILKTVDANVTVFRTRPVNPATTVSADWLKCIEISDLYVLGPHQASYGPANGVAFDLQGVQYGRFHNLHVEGFPRGFNLLDGSELWFTGVTIARNCYEGMYIRRSRAVSTVVQGNTIDATDMQVWFDDLVTMTNWINLTLDNPRSVWVNNGENITELQPSHSPTLSPPQRVKVVGCFTDTQIHFENTTFENHSATDPLVQIDKSGVSVLTFDRCNFETAAVDTLVRADGYFDTVAFRNCQFSRGLVLPGRAPLVQLRAPGSFGGTDTNDQRRAPVVVLEGNTPAVAETWVANAFSRRDPLADVVPAGWEQVSPRPELDETFPGVITVTGPTNYAFATSGQLTGKGRLYFTSNNGNSPSNNKIEVFLAREVASPMLIYVTMIVADAGGAYVPVVDALRDASGTSWNAAWLAVTYAKLETYTIGTVVFQKYAFSISVLDPQAGLKSIRFANFYAPASAQSSFGIETLNVYLNTRLTGRLERLPRRKSSIPVATDGVPAAGDFVENSAPTEQGSAGSKYVVTGWRYSGSAWLQQRALTGN